MSESLEEKVVKYILTKNNDLSPFRLSRILILSELEYLRRYGEKPLAFYYVIYPSAFYIDGFADFLSKIDGLEKVVVEEDGKKRGYFHLHSPCDCELAENLKSVIDEVMDKVKGLSDQELNDLVIKREDYKSYIQS